MAVVAVVSLGVPGCADAPPELTVVMQVEDLRLIDRGDGCIDLGDESGPQGTCWRLDQGAELGMLARGAGGDGAVLAAVLVDVPEVASVMFRGEGVRLVGEQQDYSGDGRLFTLVGRGQLSGRLLALDEDGRVLVSSDPTELRPSATLTVSIDADPGPP